MTNYLYSPAPASAWMAVASDQQLILVNSRDAELLAQLWGEVANGMHAVVGVLTARGLTKMPAFAFVQWSSSGEGDFTARVIVRGAIEVAMATTTGAVNFSGAQVSTWSEHTVEGAVACDVSTDVASQECSTPLIAGVVSAERVRCSLIGTTLARDNETSVAASAGSVPKISAEFAVAEPSVDATEPTDDHDVQQVQKPEQETQVPVAEATIVDRPTANPAAADGGDHDGMTIMTGELRKLRADRASEQSVAQAAGISLVPASRPLFLELSTGSREPLTQPILVGRAPSVSKVSGGALPRLVTIPGDKDISRNHVQLVVEGGTVVVTDLHSRNGTHVLLPGKTPQRLRAGEPTAVIVGTVVDLGGDVTLTVCEGL